MEKTVNKPAKKMFLSQKPMFRVCYALAPLVGASVWFYGWRSLLITGLVLIAGTATEAAFALRRGGQITSAVFVTCMIFTLSLPPTLPFWMAIVGIVVAVSIGKMAFGGFGQNIFNPAMAGRCFLYITFPVQMTNTWAEPFIRAPAGLSAWSVSADAITRATPLVRMKEGLTVNLQDLFWGTTSGSLGEASAFLILLGASYIIYKKAAPWRLALSCVSGALFLSLFINPAGSPLLIHMLELLLSGSFLFGTAFVVTEPITAPKTSYGQWIYGFVIGGLTVLLREYSNFSEGLMFSVLLMNAAAPMLDRGVNFLNSRQSARA